MTETVKLIVTILLIAVQILTAIVAVVKGLTKRKTSKHLSKVEQENDLYDYMVNETANMERFAKVIKNSMTKDELSKYKRDTVMKNMTLYARANGYSWYDESVWGNELTKYIEQANATAGKVTAVKSSAN